ncbi:branched chain amino acid ABC transporter ATPase [Klebsiella pneumoniae]|uniref:High-affinity branched-chain amino acid transport ATP-binding protein LivG n=1 Tax=Klebsiella pneumoniae TaxID=573 RepID=A0A378B097_KLEPN|nr:branched chain amino acid ABC transporter ATPase [Klebsiella pneumoniae]
MTDSILRVEHLMMHFGGIKALNDVNLEVERGSITALIGPNGAGKTTVFNCLTGFLSGDGGQYRAAGAGKGHRCYSGAGAEASPGRFSPPGAAGEADLLQDVRWHPSGEPRWPGAHLPEYTFIPRDVGDREPAGAQHTQVNRHLLAGILNTRGYRQAESQALDRAFYWLEVVEMVDCANRLAGTLSYGQQRRLEIARAMCTRPEMICLDEPAAGLNPVETQALSRIIRFLRQQHGITVLLIEHDMGMVMEISDHIIVLDHGDVIARGAPQAIQANASVIAAYLGAEEEETRR